MQDVLTPVLKQQAFPRSDLPPELSTTVLFITENPPNGAYLHELILCVKGPGPRPSFIDTGLPPIYQRQ